MLQRWRVVLHLKIRVRLGRLLHSRETFDWSSVRSDLNSLVLNQRNCFELTIELLLFTHPLSRVQMYTENGLAVKLSDCMENTARMSLVSAKIALFESLEQCASLILKISSNELAHKCMNFLRFYKHSETWFASYSNFRFQSITKTNKDI